MALFKCVYSGTFQSGEQFSTGHWVETVANENASDVARDVADAYTNSPWEIEGALHTGDYLRKLTVYKYPDIGGESVDAAEVALDLQGTGAQSQALPTQCAIVVSLRSGMPGRAKRGRMYIPARNIGLVGSNGHILTAQSDGLADAVAAYMGAVNVLAVRKCVIVSRTLKTSFPIVSVDVGSIVDTQRRRRADLVEVRTSTSVSQI